MSRKKWFNGKGLWSIPSSKSLAKILKDGKEHQVNILDMHVNTNNVDLGKLDDLTAVGWPMLSGGPITVTARGRGYGGGGDGGGGFMSSGSFLGTGIASVADDFDAQVEAYKKNLKEKEDFKKELQGRVEEASKALERKGEHETDPTKALGYSFASKELRRVLASLNGDVAGYLMEGQDE